MHLDTQRCYLPAESISKGPVLDRLHENGLPSLIQWSFHSSGPFYSFEFQLLSEGGCEFDASQLERLHKFFPGMGEVVRIGEYAYSFLDYQLRTSVVVCIDSGMLYLLSFERESIVTEDHDGEMLAQRIPVFFQFLNSRADWFELCMVEFLRVSEVCRVRTKKKVETREQWMMFDSFVRRTDASALEVDGSFWQCVLGDQLDPFI